MATAEAAGTSTGARSTAPASLPAPRTPDKPEWLSEEAGKVWDSLAAALPAGTVGAEDAYPFGMWCTQLATYAEAEQVIQASGLLIAAGFGDEMVPNPALAIRNSAEGAASKWAAYFFGTPKDRRTRVPENPGEPEQPGGQVMPFAPRLVTQPTSPVKAPTVR